MDLGLICSTRLEPAQVAVPSVLPEHTAHEQQMLGDLCWVEEGRTVGAQAGQESPGSPGAVFAGPAQPQAPQIGTRPLPETEGRDQLWSQGGLGFTAAPFLNDDGRNCNRHQDTPEKAAPRRRRFNQAVRRNTTEHGSVQRLPWLPGTNPKLFLHKRP